MVAGGNRGNKVEVDTHQVAAGIQVAVDTRVVGAGCTAGSGILVAEGNQVEEDTGSFVGWEVGNKFVAGEDTPVAGDMVGSAEVGT